MSRIEECLNQLPEMPLLEWMAQLSERLITSQQLQNCEVYLDAHYTKPITKNQSGILSEELIELHNGIKRVGDKVEVCSGLTVPFINACPCTQRWGMREFYEELIAHGYEPERAEMLMHKAPLQAHTNFGKASLKIWSEHATHAQLYAVLDRAVPIVRELLKGMDEHTLVRQAHKDGQFCEDNARAVVQEVVNEFDSKVEDTSLIEITVDVEESVHFHNLHSQVTSQFGDLKRNLADQAAD